MPPQWRDPCILLTPPQCNRRTHPVKGTASADFNWDIDAGETHFSKHYFTIEVWRYDQKQDAYTKALSYRTTHQYDGGDSADAVRVIAPEHSEILHRLHTLNLNH